jgi:hypothetical protein
VKNRSRVQLLRVQGFNCFAFNCFAFNCLRLSIAFGVQYSIFDIQSFSIASRSIACGVQLLAAFNSFAFKGLIASGVQ